jgi:NADH-quinone oxidoreductase subunit M
VYLLMATRRFLWGPVTIPANRSLRDLGGREIGLMVPLIVLCFWIGVAPNPFLARADGSIDALLARIDRARAARTASVEPPPTYDPSAPALAEETRER